ncbi:MAG: MFS transporter [Candidatus Lokiarchaeota archaeon]|nr:MFS transporter [Candidatus Lokiarchaeota archaeon]
MNENIELPEESVSVKAKLSYSIGGLANGLLNGLVFANLTFFYNVKLGADEGLLIIGWLIFIIWNTINDPIASYIVDNTRTKIGRRVPYIRYGSIFYGLAFIFCWFPISPLDNQVGLFINFTLALFLLDTMFTIVGVCFFSLPNEIAITAKGRASIGAYNYTVGLINLVLGLILPIVLLTGQEGIHPLFGSIIIIIGIGSSVLLFITSFGIKENMFTQLQEHEGFIEGLKLTFKNRPFWILMIPAFLIATLYPIFFTGILYYIDYIIPGQSPVYVLLGTIIGIILGLILTLKKIAKWQPKKTMIINAYLIVIGLILLFTVGYNAILASIPYLLIGIGYGGAAIGNFAIMGDVIDNDELITGKRREAVYGGVNAIVTKPSVSIANTIFLAIISGFGFISEQHPQDNMAIIGIMIAYCIVPAILLFFTAISLRWYPLDGPEWLQKKKQIIKIHEDKEREYLESLSKKSKPIDSE